MAGEVGFEPTIPVLETGALDQAKLHTRELVRPGGIEPPSPEPQSDALPLSYGRKESLCERVRKKARSDSGNVPRDSSFATSQVYHVFSGVSAQGEYMF